MHLLPRGFRPLPAPRGRFLAADLAAGVGAAEDFPFRAQVIVRDEFPQPYLLRRDPFQAVGQAFDLADAFGSNVRRDAGAGDDGVRQPAPDTHLDPRSGPGTPLQRGGHPVGQGRFQLERCEDLYVFRLRFHRCGIGFASCRLNY